MIAIPHYLLNSFKLKSKQKLYRELKEERPGYFGPHHKYMDYKYYLAHYLKRDIL